MPTSSIVASTPFQAAFQRLINDDHRLKKVIRTFEISPESIKIQTSNLPVAVLKLRKIAQFLRLCAHPAREIIINNRRYTFDLLEVLYPEIESAQLGRYDKRLLMDIAKRYKHKFEAMLNILASNATIFVISTSGVYKHAQIRTGIQSKIPAEDMIGRSLLDVLPGHESTVLRLISEIQAAYDENAPREIQYGLWDRLYQGEIHPVPGENEVILICKRLA